MATTDLGPGRLEISESAQVEALEKKNALIVDPRRSRALFFDGRFLAALDLNRERDYVLSRQADLARAGGVGVVNGLMVAQAVDANTKQIQATKIAIDSGLGITPAGELVALADSVVVDLGDVPNLERLNAAFGLSQAPVDIDPGTRSGLYVVALRPVEFTSHPITAYQTSLQGARTIVDGDVNEATAITLVPFTQQILNISANEARAAAAKAIFVDEKMPPMPANCLPLAMIMLKGGHIQWVDSFMVRREVGAEHEDLVGLGLSPRAIREAFLLQYDQHLNDVLATSAGRQIAAADYFHSLPPAGRMPANTINQDFTQLYFPSQVDVELSIVPVDELPTLLEESMLLSPLDLTNANDLASTSVLVLVPKPREELKLLEGKLTSLTRTLRPVAPGLIARRAPIDVLRGLLVGYVAWPTLDPQGAIDAAWRSELKGQAELYFIRRRHLNYKASISPIIVEAGRNDVTDEQQLNAWLTQAAVAADFTATRAKATALAQAEMVEWLSSPKFNPGTGFQIPIDVPPTPIGPAVAAPAVRDIATPAVVGPVGRIPVDIIPRPPIPPRGNPLPFAPLLLKAAVFDLKTLTPTTPPLLSRADVIGVESKYSDPNLGEGLTRLGNEFRIVVGTSPVPKIIDVASQTGLVADLDLVFRLISDAEFGGARDEVVKLANETPTATAVADMQSWIKLKKAEVNP